MNEMDEIKGKTPDEEMKVKSDGVIARREQLRSLQGQLQAHVERFVRGRVEATIRAAIEAEPDVTLELSDDQLRALKDAIPAVSDKAWKAVESAMAKSGIWLKLSGEPPEEGFDRARRMANGSSYGGWGSLQLEIGRLLEPGEAPIHLLLQNAGYQAAKHIQASRQLELKPVVDGVSAYATALWEYELAWSALHDAEKKKQQALARDRFERA